MESRTGLDSSQRPQKRQNCRVSRGNSRRSPSKPEPEHLTTFECNICFEVPKEAVVTLCGHIYCCSCLDHWMALHDDSAQCPVCKARVDGRSIIRIYGRGRSEAEPTIPDEEEEVPSRPSDQLAQPVNDIADVPTPIRHAGSPAVNDHFVDEPTFSTSASEQRERLLRANPPWERERSVQAPQQGERQFDLLRQQLLREANERERSRAIQTALLREQYLREANERERERRLQIALLREQLLRAGNERERERRLQTALLREQLLRAGNEREGERTLQAAKRR